MVCVRNKWVPDNFRGAQAEGWHGPRIDTIANDQSMLRAQPAVAISNSDTQQLEDFINHMQHAFLRGPDLDLRSSAGPGEFGYAYVEGDRVKVHYRNEDDGQFDLIYWTQKLDDCQS